MSLSRRQFLLLASAPALAAAVPPTAHAARGKGELPLELARVAPPGISPAGFLVSEKLDGVRALWDGQRLRFRSGLPLLAPQWFLRQLPAEPLDGELWLGRGRFEELSGAVRQAQALDRDWHALRYMVFDLPGAAGPFEQRAQQLAALVQRQRFSGLAAVAQERLADGAALQRRFDDVLRAGGEGLVLHRADAPWRPGRSDAVLKLKPVADDEAVVVAHIPGRGRHEGRLGALQVRTAQGVEFLLGTGLSDAQRDAPPPVGSTVTYQYRGRTAAGVPRFASFVRQRDPARS